jgi:lipid II isoglutaminyl synthase (glutamine-hydrolysing)
VRLKYAGVPSDRLRVVPGLAAALDQAVAATHSRQLYVLPTYTALLELRHELAERGQAVRFWEPTPA